MYCRTYYFDREGRAHSERAKQMVSTSLRDAVSCVASSFRERGRPSPFHVPHRVHGGGSIHPRVRSLLTGFESKDPLPHRQKALTPALLRDMHNAATEIVGGRSAHLRLSKGSVLLRDEGLRILPNRKAREDATIKIRKRDVQGQRRQHPGSRGPKIDREGPICHSLFHSPEEWDENGEEIPEAIWGAHTMSSQSVWFSHQENGPAVPQLAGEEQDNGLLLPTRRENNRSHSVTSDIVTQKHLRRKQRTTTLRNQPE
jgi:hypothetical protein